uniref:DUF4057 domain-containing protein n=1 Tax=Ananas comosus var. bracteatus TaxID=296719 RepID=A0A6V7P2T6_ANACO|nr:unnamed protein product [Ananas comosus var. bracteatus]
MEGRSVPVQRPHASTSDLLAWPENPPPIAAAAAAAAKGFGDSFLAADGRDQPGDVRAPMTEEEAESVSKSCATKPCSVSKLREMTGSGIFAANGENSESETDSSLSNPDNKTALRMYQQVVSAISQISFGSEESVPPKKPTTLTEVAKQRELSGTLEGETEAEIKKQISEAKSKELNGHNIFSPPPEIPTRPLAPRNLDLRGHLDFALHHSKNIYTSAEVSYRAGDLSGVISDEETAIKTAKKIHTQKFQDLTGNNIFKGDAPLGCAEKMLSTAKLKEISGSNIFSDGKAAARDYFGGVRKPPGGESSIALV